MLVKRGNSKEKNLNMKIIQKLLIQKNSEAATQNLRIPDENNRKNYECY